MSTTMAELAADEAAFGEYLATLKVEPEGLEDMDYWERSRRERDDLTGVIGGVRVTNRGTVRAVRLA